MSQETFEQLLAEYMAKVARGMSMSQESFEAEIAAQRGKGGRTHLSMSDDIPPSAPEPATPKPSVLDLTDEQLIELLDGKK